MGFYALPGRWVFDLGAVTRSAADGTRLAAWWCPGELGAGDRRGYSERSEWPWGFDCVEGLHKGLDNPAIPANPPGLHKNPVSLYGLTVILLFLYIAQP